MEVGGWSKKWIFMSQWLLNDPLKPFQMTALVVKKTTPTFLFHPQHSHWRPEPQNTIWWTHRPSPVTVGNELEQSLLQNNLRGWSENFINRLLLWLWHFPDVIQTQGVLLQRGPHLALFSISCRFFLAHFILNSIKNYEISSTFAPAIWIFHLPPNLTGHNFAAL